MEEQLRPQMPNKLFSGSTGQKNQSKQAAKECKDDSGQERVDKKEQKRRNKRLCAGVKVREAAHVP